MSDSIGGFFRMPIKLEPNTFQHFYQGGKLRAEFMGEPYPDDDYRPEEWMFSTNEAHTPGKVNDQYDGISKVHVGGNIIPLTGLLEAFTIPLLGFDHRVKFGSKLGILVKIFDTARYIPVHWHPAPDFSKKHLNSPFGKTEAWIIIATRPNAKVWIGWKEDVTRDQITDLFKRQSGDEMRKLMHAFDPKEGDIFYLPAGTPHSLFGCCVLEPQEPTDFSFIVEWKDLGLIQESDGLLGLPWDTTLDSLNLRGIRKHYIDNFIKMEPQSLWEEGANIEYRILPHIAEKYFRATKMLLNGPMRLIKNGFYCIIVTEGKGYLDGFGQKIPLKKGSSYFMPDCCSNIPYTLIPDKEMKIYFFQPGTGRSM